jgi:hypothetical protein
MRYIEFDLHDERPGRTIHVRSDAIITLRQMLQVRSDLSHTELGLSNGTSIKIKGTPASVLETLELIALEDAVAAEQPVEPTGDTEGNEGNENAGGNAGGRARGGRQS